MKERTRNWMYKSNQQSVSVNQSDFFCKHHSLVFSQSNVLFLESEEQNLSSLLCYTTTQRVCFFCLCLEGEQLSFILLHHFRLHFLCRYFALSSQRLESLRTSLQGSSPTSLQSTASTISSCSRSSRLGLLENGEE